MQIFAMQLKGILKCYTNTEKVMGQIEWQKYGNNNNSNNNDNNNVKWGKYKMN